MSFVVQNLRQSLHHTRKRLGQIVINHHYREQYQEDERRLINPLLDVQADIAAHQALHEQQQNDTAVEDGNGQQVKDAKVQADRGCQAHQRGPAFFAGRLSGGATDSDWSLNGAERDLAAYQLLQQLEDQHRTLFIVLERPLKSRGERQFPHFGGNALNADAITFLFYALHVGQNRL